MWALNLLSALLIAEVAINQYETSHNDVPSSFIDFAETNLQSKTGGIVVSFLRIFVNWCVVSFNLIQMGEILVASWELPALLESKAVLDIPEIPHAIAINVAASVLFAWGKGGNGHSTGG